MLARVRPDEGVGKSLRSVLGRGVEMTSAATWKLPPAGQPHRAAAGIADALSGLSRSSGSHALRACRRRSVRRLGRPEALDHQVDAE